MTGATDILDRAPPAALAADTKSLTVTDRFEIQFGCSSRAVSSRERTRIAIGRVAEEHKVVS